MEFEKRTILTPAWDKRHPDNNQNYGMHGVELQMYLIGEHGAVNFCLMTGWLLPESLAHPFRETREVPEPIHLDWNSKFSTHDYSRLMSTQTYWPMPFDLGYHAKEPQYDHQYKRDDCPYTKDGICYYDGSGLNAIPVFDILLREGSDGVWAKLEEYYGEVFLNNER